MSGRSGRTGRPKGSGVTPIRDRFFAKVVKGDDCWIWIGLKDRKGYGRFGISREIGMKSAHRVSYEMHNGAIPAGMCVCHSCDTPACVNPAHLWLGTKSANNKDMHDKGRGRYIGWKFVTPEARLRGEANHSKLTEVQVRALREDYANGLGSFVVLGKKYGIGHTTVENIVKRRKWAHVR